MAHKAAAKAAVKRLLASTRPYSQLQFTPNEVMHNIDSSKLTQAEIDRVIPKRPDYSHLPKYHHEMLSPEYIADIVVRPTFNDVVVTALAKDSPFSGNPSYRFVSQTSSFSEQTVSLHFANMVAKWVDVFNDQIMPLSSLGEEQALEFTNAERTAVIEGALLQFQAERNLYDENTLWAFFAKFGVFKAKKDLDLTDRKKVSFDNIAEHLFRTTEVAEDIRNFKALLAFVEKHIGLCTNDGLERILTTLIKHLHGSRDQNASQLHAFDAFFNHAVVEVYPHISSKLSPHVLDRLAQIFTSSSNLKEANAILVILSKQKKTAPSKDTFESYLAEYAKLVDTSSPKKYRKEKILQELHKLKPVFFHHGLNNNSFHLLLDHVIDNVYDLDQLLRLVEATGHSKIIFSDNGPAILSKLRDLQNDSSDSQLVKSLQLTQLVRKIADGGKSLDGESKKAARDMYVSLGQAANAECI